MRRQCLPLLPLFAAALALPGCRDPEYDQSSPEALVASAKEMVAAGDAHRLDDLIYTEHEEMRPVLDRVGSLLGHLQELAVAVEGAFPSEVAAIKSQAAEAAKDGKATSFIAAALTGRQNSRAGSRRDWRAELNQTLKQIAADPFGWLQESEERIGFIWVADDTRSVTWDGQILFPPWGLLIKERGGKWYLALPTDHPVVAENLPKSKEFWQIAPEIVQIVDNVVIDMIEDVERGRVQELSLLAQETGKKLVPMAAIGFFAMGKVMEAEQREEREAREARERLELERAEAEEPDHEPDDEAPPADGG